MTAGSQDSAVPPLVSVPCDIWGSEHQQRFLLFLCSLNIRDKIQGLASVAEAALSLQSDLHNATVSGHVTAWPRL